MFPINLEKRCVPAMVFIMLGIILYSFWFSPTLYAQTISQAQTLFEEKKHAVFQIRIINKDTQSPSSFGSGFFVSNDGLIITNFHVVSSLINRPELYEIMLLTEDNQNSGLKLISVDVLNDLALLKTDYKPKRFLRIEDGLATKKGEAIFSLGNPRNLGTTVVEGSYSGTVEHSLYERIHFTGSLNPGMSGGPTLNTSGDVIGVNVATSGNQISFLVKPEYASALIKSHDKIVNVSEYKLEIRNQLVIAQKNLSNMILNAEKTNSELGPFSVPDKLVTQLECWGDTPDEQDKLYTVSSKSCSTQEYVFLSDSHYLKPLEYSFDYFRSNSLNAFSFAKLFGDFYGSMGDVSFVKKGDVSNFQCYTRFVDQAGLIFRVTFCLRDLHDYEGLYDFSIKLGTMIDNKEGLQGRILLGGITKENAAKITRRLFEDISWKR